MIELGNPQGSIVKQFPETIHFGIKIAAASLVFILMMLLSAQVDEVQIALPIQSGTVPVYSQIPEEDEIDYEEFMNRFPLRKPAPKPGWQDWFSETQAQVASVDG